MSTLTTINSGDLITNSRANINNNFSALNTEKMETSVLDTDNTFAANSDVKVPSQKAVKAYVDTGGNVNASETTKGIVEEATDAEVTAGTATGATGATGAKLFITPAKLQTYIIPLLAKNIRSFTTGENLTAGDAVVVGNGTTAYKNIIQDSTNASILVPTTATLGQTFTTSASAKKITSIEAYLTVNNTTNNWEARIYATSGGLPTGSPLGTRVFGKNNTAAWITVGFTTPIAITPSSVYALVILADANATSPFWSYQNGDVYAGGSMVNGTWSADTAKDLAFRIHEIINVAGYVYKTDANVTPTTEFCDSFIGFANETKNSGEATKIIVGGVADTLSGLTTGSTYYLSDTAGAISTSAGSVSRKIGIALSATELLIKHDNV